MKFFPSLFFNINLKLILGMFADIMKRLSWDVTIWKLKNSVQYDTIITRENLNERKKSERWKQKPLK